MVKIVAIYDPPEDQAAFERHYRTVHMPLAMKIPGLIRCELGWSRAALDGAARHALIGELYFADDAALQAALESPEGRAAAADVSRFAGSAAHIIIAKAESYEAGR